MAEYIKREDALAIIKTSIFDLEYKIKTIPAADVVEEENILKFYYVRSIDEYWIGRRIDNFYYAEYDPEICQWTWTHSRYLPWGEHIVSPTSLWKEHTYPSEPEEIPFAEWLQGFIKKHADVVERETGKWIEDSDPGEPIGSHWTCTSCRHCFGVNAASSYGLSLVLKYCPNCGAKMIGGDEDV